MKKSSSFKSINRLKVSITSFVFILTVCYCMNYAAAQQNKLPIGMNINSSNYYSEGIIYTNVMNTASSIFTFYNGGPWDSKEIENIPVDSNGYPLKVPVNINGEDQKIRFLINNFYNGKFVILYDGVGQLKVNGATSVVENNQLFVNLNGKGGHVWIDILSSEEGNHLRNIRILPEEYATGGEYPTFLANFLEGLRPFHALRFMDWMSTNNSPQKHWSDRAKPSDYTQSTGKGQAIEYAIELANTLNEDAWFCVPHLASDDYIIQMAGLIREKLNPNLKVYIEYSNEVWNWQFQQASWVLNNATGSVDQYVIDDLIAINPASAGHPEKDAYMMARVFRLFGTVFTGQDANRLVKVAAVQHAWVDNTRRILKYLKDANEQCDVVSPAGYFGFQSSDHEAWLADCDNVTAEKILDDTKAGYESHTATWTSGTAQYAKEYNVGYVVYEGGQHMQPQSQSEWCYNDSLYAAQIHPKMYDLYMQNFAKHADTSVNCQLFMAFSYTGSRKSKYGSWGHLENINQIEEANGDFMSIAPKYQALLDANTPKLVTHADDKSTSRVLLFPNPANDLVTITTDQSGTVIKLMDFRGNLLKQVITTTNESTLSVAEYPSGIYLISLQYESDITYAQLIIE